MIYDSFEITLRDNNMSNSLRDKVVVVTELQVVLDARLC